MISQPETIALLNRQLRLELTASNRYRVLAELAKQKGYGKLAEHYKSEADEEAGHANMLLERLALLEGLPELNYTQEAKVTGDPEEWLKDDLDIETDAVGTYTECVEKMLEIGDQGSRLTFEKVLHDEEEAVYWLESQFRIINKIGLDNYLQNMI